MQTASRKAGRAAGGMTLIELLVVIVLITVLVSTAIPVISPGGEGRRLREASRSVNAYLQGAQARAVQTGRPFGVALTRLSADNARGSSNGVCLRMEYVEVPPTYSGFEESSAVRVAVNPLYADGANDGDDDLYPLRIQFVARGATLAGLPAGWAADLLPPLFFRPGDTVEVMGRRYVLMNGTGASTLEVGDSGYFEPPTGTLVTFAARPENFVDQETTLTLAPLSVAYDANGREIPSPDELAGLNPAPITEPYWTAPAPYRVFRQPTPAAGEPYDLPTGAAIDLQASVIVSGSVVTQLYEPSSDFDAAPDDFTIETDPLMILFAPEGRVHRVHGVTGDASPRPVSGYVALCVGRPELIPGRPYGVDLDSVSAMGYRNPLDQTNTAYTGLAEDAQYEAASQYNWLNLESRWVVIGGQSGSVATIEGVSVLGQPTLTGQIAATLENASSRRTAGGR